MGQPYQIFGIIVFHGSDISTSQPAQSKLSWIKVLQIIYATNGDKFATILLFPCLLLVFICPVFFTILIIKNKDKIIEEDEQFKEKYGSLFDELSTKHTFCLLWKTLSLYKMLLICLIVLYLDSYPMIQLILILLLQLFSEIALIHFKPNEDP